MVELSRAVRLIINPDDGPGAFTRPGHGFAGTPSPRGLPVFTELTATCRGEIDPVCGYLLDIKRIDSAVRRIVAPLIAAAFARLPQPDAGRLLHAAAVALAADLPVPLCALLWSLTPMHSLEIEMNDPGVVLLRQRFDFAASHRLHIASLSDAENRARFGKCNNAAGHGHNYRIEPCVAIPFGSSFTVSDLERLTEETVIRRFDHTHLNEDTAEFSAAGGVNPTVENIARVFHDLLAPVLSRAAPGVALRSITVWETDRTSATYPA